MSNAGWKITALLTPVTRGIPELGGFSFQLSNSIRCTTFLSFLPLVSSMKGEL